MISDERLFEIIASAEKRFGKPFTTAKEVANEVGMERQSVHRRLQRLKEENKEVQKYKPGRAAVWWVEDA